MKGRRPFLFAVSIKEFQDVPTLFSESKNPHLDADIKNKCLRTFSSEESDVTFSDTYDFIFLKDVV